MTEKSITKTVAGLAGADAKVAGEAGDLLAWADEIPASLPDLSTAASSDSQTWVLAC